MKRLVMMASALVLLTTLRPAWSQHTSPAIELANIETAMIVLGCQQVGAGILLGTDPAKLYIATARHVVNPAAGCTDRSIAIALRDGGPTRPPRKPARIEYSSPEALDVSVISVARDADVERVLRAAKFDILAGSPLRPSSIVHSIGKSNWLSWTLGRDEVLVSPPGDTFEFRSNVDEGQSGGGVFDDSWELVGMVQRRAGDRVWARSIDSVIRIAKAANIPVALVPRSALAHAATDAERALTNVANLFAERARRSLELGDPLAAISYLAEAQTAAATPLVKAQRLLVAEQPLKRMYALMPIGPDPYSAIAVSGTTLAVAISGGVVELRQLADGKVLRVLKPAPSAITSLAFNADGSQLVGGLSPLENQPMTVAVWSTSSDAPPVLIPLANVGGWFDAVYFSGPDRIVGLVSTTLFVVDLPARRELRRVRTSRSLRGLRQIAADEYLAQQVSGDAGKVVLIKFANDSFAFSELTACAPTDLSFGQWQYKPVGFIAPNLVARACQHSLELSDKQGGSQKLGVGHTEFISAVAAIPGLRAFATGSWDGSMRVWSDRGEQLARSGVHHGGIRDLAVSAAGDVIVALEADVARFKSGNGGAVSVWSYRHDLTAAGLPSLPSLPSPLTAVGLPPPPSLPSVVAPGGGPSPGPPPGPPPDGGAAPPGPSGTPSSFTMFNGEGVCWKKDAIVYAQWDGQEVSIVDSSASPRFSPVRMVMTPDCMRAVVILPDGLHVFRRGNPTSKWSPAGVAPTRGIVAFAKLAANANVVAWAEQDQASIHVRVRSWDVDSGKQATHIDQQDELIWAIGISAAGDRIASYIMGGAIKVFDRSTNKELLSEVHPIGTPTSLVFLEESNALLIGTASGMAIWGLDGTKRNIAIPGANQIPRFEVFDDGTLAIVQGTVWGDTGAHVWILDLRGQQVLTSTKLPLSPVQWSLSPDGTRLACWFHPPSKPRLYGLSPALDRAGAEALTGQRWSGAALGPN